MKTAYELAMERLSKASPTVKLTTEQKSKLAELDSKYRAKIAERELALEADIQRAAARGEVEKTEELKKQLAHERKRLQAELEGKKEQVREGKS